MKNYYLKRIDELKTEIGSDRNSRPIASAIRALGTGGAIKLADKLSRSGPKKRKGGPKDREGDSEGTLVRRTPTPHRRGLGNRTTRTSETGASSKDAAMKAAGEVAAKNAAIKAAREVQDQNAAIKAAGEEPTNTADEKPKFGAGLSTDAKPIGRSSRGKIGPVPEKPKRDLSNFGAGIPTRDKLKAQRVKRRRADFAASQARKAGTASDVAAAKFRASQDRKAGSAETSDLKAKFQNLSTGSGNKARRRIKQIGADRIAKFKAAMDQKRKDASDTRAFRGRVLRYNRIGNTERGTNEPNSTTRKRTQGNPVDDRSFRFRQKPEQQSYSRFGDSTTYIQIGYILAESMGLIEEGKFKNLANKAAEAGKQTAFVAKEVGKDIVYTVPKETVAMTKEAIAAVRRRLPKSKK